MSQETAAYLQWLAKNIVPEDTVDAVARHLVMQQIDGMRRANRKEEPAFSEMPPAADEKK